MQIAHVEDAAELIQMEYAWTQIALELGSANENDDAVEGRFGEFEE